MCPAADAADKKKMSRKKKKADRLILPLISFPKVQTAYNCHAFVVVCVCVRRLSDESQPIWMVSYVHSGIKDESNCL